MRPVFPNGNDYWYAGGQPFPPMPVDPIFGDVHTPGQWNEMSLFQMIQELKAQLASLGIIDQSKGKGVLTLTAVTGDNDNFTVLAPETFTNFSFTDLPEGATVTLVTTQDGVVTFKLTSTLEDVIYNATINYNVGDASYSLPFTIIDKNKADTEMGGNYTAGSGIIIDNKVISIDATDGLTFDGNHLKLNIKALSGLDDTNGLTIVESTTNTGFGTLVHKAGLVVNADNQAQANITHDGTLWTDASGNLGAHLKQVDVLEDGEARIGNDADGSGIYVPVGEGLTTDVNKNVMVKINPDSTNALSVSDAGMSVLVGDGIKINDGKAEADIDGETLIFEDGHIVINPLSDLFDAVRGSAVDLISAGRTVEFKLLTDTPSGLIITLVGGSYTTYSQTGTTLTIEGVTVSNENGIAVGSIAYDGMTQDIAIIDPDVFNKGDVYTAGDGIDITTHIVRVKFDNNTIVLDGQGRLKAVAVEPNWGSIGGSISNQTDLMQLLDTKLDNFSAEEPLIFSNGYLRLNVTEGLISTSGGSLHGNVSSAENNAFVNQDGFGVFPDGTSIVKNSNGTISATGGVSADGATLTSDNGVMSVKRGLGMNVDQNGLTVGVDGTSIHYDTDGNLEVLGGGGTEDYNDLTNRPWNNNGNNIVSRQIGSDTVTGVTIKNGGTQTNSYGTGAGSNITTSDNVEIVSGDVKASGTSLKNSSKVNVTPAYIGFETGGENDNSRTTKLLISNVKSNGTYLFAGTTATPLIDSSMFDQSLTFSNSKAGVKIKPLSGITSDAYGLSVAIDGDTIKYNASGQLVASGGTVATVNWGSIDGTINNQTDLIDMFNTKANTFTPIAPLSFTANGLELGYDDTLSVVDGKLHAVGGSGGTSDYNELTNKPWINEENGIIQSRAVSDTDPSQLSIGGGVVMSSEAEDSSTSASFGVYTGDISTSVTNLSDTSNMSIQHNSTMITYSSTNSEGEMKNPAEIQHDGLYGASLDGGLSKVMTQGDLNTQDFIEHTDENEHKSYQVYLDETNGALKHTETGIAVNVDGETTFIEDGVLKAAASGGSGKQWNGQAVINMDDYSMGTSTSWMVMTANEGDYYDNSGNPMSADNLPAAGDTFTIIGTHGYMTLKVTQTGTLPIGVTISGDVVQYVLKPADYVIKDIQNVSTNWFNNNISVNIPLVIKRDDQSTQSYSVVSVTDISGGVIDIETAVVMDTDFVTVRLLNAVSRQEFTGPYVITIKEDTETIQYRAVAAIPAAPIMEASDETTALQMSLINPASLVFVPES
jgi:hypothetical protein